MRSLERAGDEAREQRALGARGLDAQAPRRRVETEIRRHACHVVDCAERLRVDRGLVATAIGVDVATLAEWVARRDRPAPTPLGKPPMECSRLAANRVRHQLAVYGPGVGVRTLKPEFPDISWRDLTRIVHGFRASLDACLKSCVYRSCTWTVPGLVWAMDYRQAPAPIDGVYRHLLDVRDLSSGFLVGAAPCERADAETTIATLQALFVEHGRPLVLKADNGSHFTDHRVRAFLVRERVVLLLSPVEMPQYNGACEAGHGAHGARAEALARRDGSPGRWSSNHVAGARVWVNRTVHDGTTPERLWDSRQIVDDAMRGRFSIAIGEAARRRRLDIEAQLERGNARHIIELDALSRQAIVESLLGCGYLEIRSRPIRQRVPWLKIG